MYDIIDYLSILGFLCPTLLGLASLWFLRHNYNYLTIYAIGYAVNIGVNYFLKGIIKEPRPDQNQRLINLLNLYDNNKTRISNDQYGMPSGNMQLSTYSTLYVFLVLKNKPILVGYSLLSLLCFWQRFSSNSHTFIQALVGSLIGLILAYVCYLYSTDKIQGVLREKEDDDAPL